MTARLILVRHAKSDYPWGVDDHDRPLNERGRRDAPEIGTWLAANVHWSGAAPLVLVSTARRAQLTWSLAATRLSADWGDAEVRDEARIYEADVSALQDVVVSNAPADGTVLLVGHNPGLVELIAQVCVADDMSQRAIAKFPTSSVAVLEGEAPLAEAVREGGALRVTSFAVPRG
jgi:phosphohistidine phosphatase